MMTMTRFANDESLLIQAQNGDSEAVELYLSAFVPFLNTIAKRFLNPVLSSQELCQAGYIGLMLALQRYDDTQNVHFMTYAMPWVLGEMKKALRRASDLSEGQQRSQAIAQQLGKLSSILGREPRIDELADFCKTNPSEIIWALEGGCVPQSLDHPCEENGKTLLEILMGKDSIDDESTDIHLALGRLSDQERTLIILRYFRDHTQKETAKLMKLSQAQISRIERRALESLRFWLT